MSKLSWGTKLMVLFGLVLSLSLLIQLFYTTPTVRKWAVEMAQAQQKQVAHSIAREVGDGFSRLEKQLLSIATQPISTHLASLLVLDAQGQLVARRAEGLPVYIPKSYTDWPLFTIPFESGEPYLGSPRFNPSTEIVSVPMAVPIESRTGEQVGVLISSMSLNDIIDYVANYPLEKNQVAFVVDSAGRVVAHSDIGLFALEGGPLSLNYRDKPLVDGIMAGKPARDHEGLHDHGDVPFFGCCSVLESNGWGVVVEAPMSAILAKSDALVERLLFSNIGLFAVALAASLILTWRITAARSRAEATLKESEQRFHSLFTNVPVGLYRTTPEGRLLDANPALAQMLGYPDRESLLDFQVSDLYADAQERARALSVLAQEQVVPSSEIRLLHRNGTTLIAEDSARAIYDGDGQVLYYEGSLKDVTERRQAEEMLRQSEERLRLVVESMPVMLDAFDANGNIIAWNRECERVTGYSAEEMIGNPKAVELLYPDADYLQRTMAEWAERGNAFRDWELELTAKDGGIKTIAWTNISDQFPIPGWASWSIGVDITERLRLEEQLLQSRKIETVGRLAGGIAHEFNNQLTVVNGYCELLLGHLDAHDPMRNDVQAILVAGQRSATLTRQLLGFSQRQLFRPRPFDLNQLLLDMTATLRELIGDEITLVFDLADGTGIVEADPEQIEEAIIHLAENARDAMPAGGTLSIETTDIEIDRAQARDQAALEPGPYLVLSVSDDGVGMGPEILEHLFEPFFTTKGVGEGTGLGLAMVYGIVRQSGGDIQVYSQEGQGTTFEIYLPRARDADATGAEEGATDTARG